MDREMEKAGLLIEALPYFKKFQGRHVVIKYGGNAMIDEELKRGFALNVILLQSIGIKPVVVHGGGPQIGKMLGALNIPSEFKSGYRVTDEATMDVVEMVLVGQVNKNIVNLINTNGGRAVGLSGKDGMLIKARKMELAISRKDAPPEIIDLGKVGQVDYVSVDLIYSLEEAGIIPVIAPVGVDEKGETYNINADSVAGAVAGALGAKRLHLLTDVEGILDAEGQLIGTMTAGQTLENIESGVIQGGMIPKVRCCMDALWDGVDRATILDGRQKNCILLELFTKNGVGTQVIRD